MGRLLTHKPTINVNQFHITIGGHYERLKRKRVSPDPEYLSLLRLPESTSKYLRRRRESWPAWRNASGNRGNLLGFGGHEIIIAILTYTVALEIIIYGVEMASRQEIAPARHIHNTVGGHYEI